RGMGHLTTEVHNAGDTDADGPKVGTDDGWSIQMMISSDFARDPRPYYEALRNGAPRRDDLEMPGQSRTVVLSRYEDVEAAFRNPQLFSSQFGVGSGSLGNDRPLIPLMIDPPEHKKYRVLLDPYFAPRHMAKLEEGITTLVNGLIDQFVDKEGCEFTSEFAVPMPCTAFLELLGLPLEDLDFFLHIKEGIVRGHGKHDMTEAAEARAESGRACYDYFEKVLDRLQEERGTGLLCDLLEAEVDGVRLTREEIMDICFLFILAGLDTVTDSLCCFFNYLAEHPDQRQQIVDDPDVIPSVVEELLRWESPVAGVARIVTRDDEIRGCPVHKGDSVLVFVGAANTDPEAIERADVVDFDRTANRHYAFGGGIHRCLGSHLARLELRVALREWHKRIPNYRVAEGAELVWTPMLRSVHQLPLVFG
ncbi:MAG TPA: cytochrome P450, partial [Acidimicrobiales bacterium]|nr:cytochrome P450 [Acidimicrobiales bacterium]